MEVPVVLGVCLSKWRACKRKKEREREREKKEKEKGKEEGGRPGEGEKKEETDHKQLLSCSA